MPAAGSGASLAEGNSGRRRVAFFCGTSFHAISAESMKNLVYSPCAHAWPRLKPPGNILTLPAAFWRHPEFTWFNSKFNVIAHGGTLNVQVEGVADCHFVPCVARHEYQQLLPGNGRSRFQDMVAVSFLDACQGDTLKHVLHLVVLHASVRPQFCMCLRQRDTWHIQLFAIAGEAVN